MSHSLNILIADDHVLIRDGLKHSLLKQHPNADISEAGSAQQVLKLLEKHQHFDVILLDLYMPGTTDFQLLSNLCDNYPELSIIVLSASEEHHIMRKVLDIGASGFIPKSTAHNVIFSAIDLVLNGGVYIPPSMLDIPSATNIPQESSLLNKTNATSEPSSAKNNELDCLTKRQQEVLSLMIKGLPNKLIARTLDVSENTIKIHVTAILKALNVTNRTQAVVMAQKITQGLARSKAQAYHD